MNLTVKNTTNPITTTIANSETERMSIIGNDADEGYAGDYQLRDALVQKLADRVNIVGIVTHKLAVRMRVKIAYGKALHLIKHILAQVTKHRCGAFEHQIV